MLLTNTVNQNRCSHDKGNKVENNYEEPQQDKVQHKKPQRKD